MLSRLRHAFACSVIALAAFVAAPAHAGLVPYDVPDITCESQTLSSITLRVCGGASGAPAGLSIHWKKRSDWEANGWADGPDLCELSLSGQPSLQHPDKSRWELLPGECEDILIGDLNFDETGLSAHGCGEDALECGTEYVFRWFAHAGRGFGRSAFGGEIFCATEACPTDRCTFTQGYWKNHGTGECANPKPGNSGKWPASATPMLLGTTAYSADELCSIFGETGSKGNCLLGLAHQLIAAKLNLANGATNCPELAQAISNADAMIGSLVVPPIGSGFIKCEEAISSLTRALDVYNNGGLCRPNCHGGLESPDLKSGASPSAPTTTTKASWGSLKSHYR